MGRHTVLTGTAALALLLLGAGTARAAEVSEVRVGTQDKKHTRIVVELDAAAGYRLSAPQPGASPELVLTLDAASEVREIASKSPLVRKVQVEPSGAGSIVRVQLTTADVAVKEMLLANPPRLVFDLAARGPIPKPDAPELAAKPDAASVPAPKQTASAEPVVVPPPAAPVPTEVPQKEAAQPSAPPVVAKTDVAPPPAPAPQPMTSEPKGVEPTPLDIPPPPPPATAAAPVKPTPPPASASKPTVAKTTAAPKPAQSGGGVFDLLSNPMVLAGVAGVVLLGFFLAMRRRRYDEDEDPLYTVMSADDASATASDVVGDRQPVLSVTPAWDADAFEASEPALRDGPRQLALGSVPVVQVEASAMATSEAEPAAEPEAFSGPEESDADSIFAAEPHSAPESDFVATGETVAVPVTAAAPVAAAPVSAEMERRLADLERRLEQLTEARERLERQVAAQTEELRVQRAAIARTQRVVRSIAKTEDIATEPVPRAPTA